MRWPLVARRIHKWLALLVAVQVVLWTATGLYMTAVHIDIIHGDHLVRPADARPFDLSALVDPAKLIAAMPDARTIRLQRLADRPVYAVGMPDGTILVDAVTGERLPPPSEAAIRAEARRRYAGDERIASIALLDEVPAEIRGRSAPVWRVEFEGWNKPTLYFSAATGELLTRRHELWRIFDFAWMLHIMDYEARENVNNPLLQVMSWAAVVMALSGGWLLVYSFSRRNRARAEQ